MGNSNGYVKYKKINLTKIQSYFDISLKRIVEQYNNFNQNDTIFFGTIILRNILLLYSKIDKNPPSMNTNHTIEISLEGRITNINIEIRDS